jgi:9-cis-epoxycarotenoid dioxygenase
MFAFCLNVPFGLPRPFSVFRISADGTRSADIPVPLLDMPLVHDFAITRRFVIFPDNQLVIRPAQLLAPATAGARTPLVCDPDKTPRFCLLPRYGSNNGRAPHWFDTPGVNCIHYVNAWDDDETGEAVLVAPVLSPPETILEIPSISTTHCLTELRFDPASGTVKSRAICSGPELEFGVINPAYTARKSRYAYLACGRYPNLKGVVKVDLTRDEGPGKPSPIVGKREFGPGKFGSEPCFVAAREARSEDHGYLLCLVGDQKGVEASELLVMDALSPTLDVIATVELPARVPPGFHGCFINRDQLSQQKP